MKMRFLHAGMAAIVAVSVSACGEKQMSYQSDVHPILKQHCMECHLAGGDGFKKSGLSMESYDTLMKGTKFGPVVKPGEAMTSALVMLIEGRADPAITMPHGKDKLPKEKIEVLKAWVQQGAKNN
jgi:hypothetical protein